MTRILTPADYVTMPWANGLGQTVEMIRVDRDGALWWRLSMASVVEDGAFSIFPQIDRNLTVISGPGFGLEGPGFDLMCNPLIPVAFPGDVPLRATGVREPSNDFNVMTLRSLPQPIVQVIAGAGQPEAPEGGTLYVFTLTHAVVGGHAFPPHHLIALQGKTRIEGGLVIAVGLAV
jgi:uncharacterized protein